jgi:hypothetical protein
MDHIDQGHVCRYVVPVLPEPAKGQLQAINTAARYRTVEFLHERVYATAHATGQGAGLNIFIWNAAIPACKALIGGKEAAPVLLGFLTRCATPARL